MNMAQPGRDNIKLLPFLSYCLIAFLLILNIVLSNIEAPPQLPDLKEFGAALAYSMSFASALIQGRSMEPRYLLTGALILVIIPWTILALVFRRNILRIIISLSVYALLLAGVSWILTLFNIHPAQPSGKSALATVFQLINIPFGYIFYLLYLLVGDTLYPLPAFILIAAFMRRYWKGEKVWHSYGSLVWGYLELILFITMMSASSDLYGGALLDALASSLQKWGGQFILVILFTLSFITWFFFSFKKLRKSLVSLISGGKGSKDSKEVKHSPEDIHTEPSSELELSSTAEADAGQDQEVVTEKETEDSRGSTIDRETIS